MYIVLFELTVNNQNVYTTTQICNKSKQTLHAWADDVVWPLALLRLDFINDQINLSLIVIDLSLESVKLVLCTLVRGCDKIDHRPTIIKHYA